MAMTVTMAITMVSANNLYLVNKMLSSMPGDLPGTSSGNQSADDYYSADYRCQSYDCNNIQIT